MPVKRAEGIEALTLAVTSADDHELLSWMAGTDAALAQLAARRLAGHDDRSRRLLAGRLARAPALPHAEAVMDALLDGPHAGRSLALLPAEALTPRQRFRMDISLAARHGQDVTPRLLEAACDPATAAWLRQDDWDLLAAQPADVLAPHAARLALCPHPFAYGLGVANLTRTSRQNPAVEQALRAFLEAGDDRNHAVRVEAARWLRRHGKKTEPRVLLPILLQEPQEKPTVPEALADMPATLVEAVTESALLAGLGEPAERMVLTLLGHRQVEPAARDRGLGRLTARATTAAVRREAGQQLRRTGSFFLDARMRRLAEVFAWGVRMGRELTGSPFGIEMITGEELGFTRLNESRIFVSPLPYLLGHQQGEEVVRALILHEYGHHLYHKGPVPEATWQQAENEGLGRLLNLVADEHLERNLRARDRRFGDLLKVLAAYAFQHNTREVPVPTLLALLKGKTLDGLRDPSRRRTPIRLRNGELRQPPTDAGRGRHQLRALRQGAAHGARRSARRREGRARAGGLQGRLPPQRHAAAHGRHARAA